MPQHKVQESIADRVIRTVAGIFRIDPKKISRETRFVEDLHAKSIDIIALLAALGGEFKIKVSPGEVQGNQTVGQAIDYIERKLKEKKD